MTILNHDQLCQLSRYLEALAADHAKRYADAPASVHEQLQRTFVAYANDISAARDSTGKDWAKAQATLMRLWAAVHSSASSLDFFEKAQAA